MPPGSPIARTVLISGISSLPAQSHPPHWPVLTLLAVPDCGKPRGDQEGKKVEATVPGCSCMGPLSFILLDLMILSLSSVSAHTAPTVSRGIMCPSMKPFYCHSMERPLFLITEDRVPRNMEIGPEVEGGGDRRD